MNEKYISGDESEYVYFISAILCYRGMMVKAFTDCLNLQDKITVENVGQTMKEISDFYKTRLDKVDSKNEILPRLGENPDDYSIAVFSFQLLEHS